MYPANNRSTVHSNVVLSVQSCRAHAKAEHMQVFLQPACPVRKILVFIPICMAEKKVNSQKILYRMFYLVSLMIPTVCT